MPACSADGLSRLIEALFNYRVASEGSAQNQNTAALIAVGLVMMAFPDAGLLREVIENSFPIAARPKQDDDLALVVMARLVVEGSELKPASRKVVKLAAPGASNDATAARLRRKFRKDGHRYKDLVSVDMDTALIIARSRSLVRGIFERKAEHEDRPFRDLSRKLKRARCCLEEILAVWEAKRGDKSPPT